MTFLIAAKKKELLSCALTKSCTGSVCWKLHNANERNQISK